MINAKNKVNKTDNLKGTIEVRHCQGDIPGRVEIVNNSIIFWTPHILPARSSFMPSFEIHDNSSTSSISNRLIEYFELLWNESERFKIQITPEKIV